MKTTQKDRELYKQVMTLITFHDNPTAATTTALLAFLETMKVLGILVPNKKHEDFKTELLELLVKFYGKRQEPLRNNITIEAK